MTTANDDPISLAAANLADIRDPEFVADALFWPWLLAATIVVFGLWFARYWRREKLPIPVEPIEVARKDLAAARRLAGAGLSEKWAMATSGAIRTYLESTTTLPATRRTTSEIINSLKESGIGGIEELRLFCTTADLLKFAQERSSARDLVLAQSRAEELLEALSARKVEPPQ